MSNPIRIALVGCGALAEVLAEEIYPNVNGLKVAAVVDRDIDRAKMFGEKFGVPFFRTMQEAVSAVDIDALDLRVPHHLHAECAIEAFTLKKHVFVEKPMGINAGEARKMLEESKKNEGKIFAVAENYDFLECVQVAKEILDSGEIGKPVFAEVHRLFHLGEEWRRTGWRGKDNKVGGVLMENGCHIARLVRHLLGNIEKVSGFQNQFASGQYPGESVAVSFKTSSGVIGTQAYSWTVGVPRFTMPEIRIVGVDGYIEVWIDYVGDRSGVQVCTLDGHKRWIPVTQSFYESMIGVMDTFVQGCYGGSLQGISANEGLADIEVSDKIFAAISDITA